MKKATIHDIAEKLDVTASTVSRALHDHPRISASTKKTVVAMAEKLNYKPNQIASALRSGKSNILGVIIPIANRSFFASILKGVDEIANQNGYKVIISQSNDSTSKEKSSIKTLLEARADGILSSFAIETKEFDHYKEVIDRGVPLIMFDRLHEKLEELPIQAVIVDDYLGAFRATEHLIQQGCERVMHLAGPQHVKLYKERKRGYIEAMKQYGKPVDDELIVESSVKVDDGKSIAQSLKTNIHMPDGIFSASDFAAAGVMEVFKARGIKVPNDVAIVGFSNEPFTSFIDLTTVDQHPVEMGKIAARLFLQRNDQNDVPVTNKTVLNPELIIRKSSLRTT